MAFTFTSLPLNLYKNNGGSTDLVKKARMGGFAYLCSAPLPPPPLYSGRATITLTALYSLAKRKNFRVQVQTNDQGLSSIFPTVSGLEQAQKVETNNMN